MGDREREREGGRAGEGGEVEDERGRAVSLLSISDEQDREDREDGGETEEGGVEVGESERAREGGERGEEEQRT